LFFYNLYTIKKKEKLGINKGLLLALLTL